MIRYRYSDQFRPPAPFVNVTVCSPDTGAAIEKVPGQLDTGADRTVLPSEIVAALGLKEDGKVKFQGFEGEIVELPIFLIAIRLHDLPPVEVRAALGKGEKHILVGRDVLNAHRILHDGPQLALEIG